MKIIEIVRYDDEQVIRRIGPVAEHVAAPLEARIAELETAVDVFQPEKVLADMAQMMDKYEARITNLAAVCHQWEEFAEHNGLRLAPETAAEDVQSLRNRITTLTTACEAAAMEECLRHCAPNSDDYRHTEICDQLRAALAPPPTPSPFCGQNSATQFGDGEIICGNPQCEAYPRIVPQPVRK